MRDEIVVFRNAVILILWCCGKMQYSRCGELANIGMLSDICLQLMLYNYWNVSEDIRVGGMGQGVLEMRSSLGNNKEKIIQLCPFIQYNYGGVELVFFSTPS